LPRISDGGNHIVSLALENRNFDDDYDMIECDVGPDRLMLAAHLADVAVITPVSD